jgi:hypothetical protein
VTVFARLTIERQSEDVLPAIMAARGVGWFQLLEDPFKWVSEEGEVLSLHRKRAIVLRPILSGDYLAVSIGRGNKTTHIHKIVCETFNGPRPFPGAQVCHLDGNRMNNAARNLAWGTAKENNSHKVLHGTDGRGERNGQAKLTRDAVRQMRAQRGLGRTFKSIADEFGVSAMTAHRAITGGSWK